MDTVQLSLTGSRNEGDAKSEFDFALEHVDTDHVAKDLPDYVDAESVGGETILARRGAHVLMLSIVRSSNKVDAFDEKRLESMFAILSTRY